MKSFPWVQAALADIEVYLKAVKKASEAAIRVSFYYSLDFHCERA